MQKLCAIAGKSILSSCIYSLYMINYVFVSAGVSELADEADSKSVFRKEVWVQVPSPAYIIIDGFKVYAPLRSALSRHKITLKLKAPDNIWGFKYL